MRLSQPCKNSNHERCLVERVRVDHYPVVAKRLDFERHTILPASPRHFVKDDMVFPESLRFALDGRDGARAQG